MLAAARTGRRGGDVEQVLNGGDVSSGHGRISKLPPCRQLRSAFGMHPRRCSCHCSLLWPKARSSSPQNSIWSLISNCEGAWHHNSANAACPRRQGDRIAILLAAVHQSGPGTHLPFTAIWRDGRSRRRSRNCRHASRRPPIGAEYLRSPREVAPGHIPRIIPAPPGIFVCRVGKRSVFVAAATGTLMGTEELPHARRRGDFEDCRPRQRPA